MPLLVVLVGRRVAFSVCESQRVFANASRSVDSRAAPLADRQDPAHDNSLRRREPAEGSKIIFWWFSGRAGLTQAHSSRLTTTPKMAS